MGADVGAASPAALPLVALKKSWYVLHVRQLTGGVVSLCVVVGIVGDRWAYGLPSGPRTMPFFVGACGGVVCFGVEAGWSSACSGKTLVIVGY